jgi:hypothetical protein
MTRLTWPLPLRTSLRWVLQGLVHVILFPVLLLELLKCVKVKICRLEESKVVQLNGTGSRRVRVVAWSFALFSTIDIISA